MIDFGLTATPSEHTAAHLAGILDTLPVTERTVNQTTYGSVTKNPIAVSIEIKTSSGSLEEANAQLGLWIAAWHKRMNLLKQCHEDIITLPLIIVMEHEWKLLFAVDRGDSIVRPSIRVQDWLLTVDRTFFGIFVLAIRGICQICIPS
jgi:hypothetical protein